MGTFEAVMLAIAGAEKIITLIGKLRESAKQGAEWTPEQEAEFKARYTALKSTPHWKIDE